MDHPQNSHRPLPPSHSPKNEHKNINKLALRRRIAVKEEEVESTSIAEETTKTALAAKIRATTKDEEEGCELDFFRTPKDEDSDYEFSQEIMLSNPKRESRRDRQKGKICHLSIADWMMRVSSMLHLTKQCAYRAIITMRRFMFLQQKKAPSRVTFSNANLYAMACLLIANKFQNYPGNFLSSIVHIEGSQDTALEKEKILECELYILTILQFTLVNHIFIVENMLEVVQEWNQQAARGKLTRYQLGRTEEVVQIWEGKEQAAGQAKRGELLEVFLYLVDFVSLRRVVELRIKELFSTVADPLYFKKIIVNVLYHLMMHLIGKAGKDVQRIELRAFNTAFANLVTKVKMQRAEIVALKRKSHLISKQLRALYSNNLKWQTIRKTADYHRTCQQRFCICELKSLSKKYLDEEQLRLKEKVYEEMYPCETRQSKRQDLSDTDHLISDKERERPQQQAQSSQINRISRDDEPDTHRVCEVCPNKAAMLRLLINQQFYIPYFINRK